MEQVIRNSEGEIIGTECIPSSYEQEIAYCEEMDRRANDPNYAARLENERWYNEACAAFEERGIEVPGDVIAALSREMRNKARKAAEDAAMAEMLPYVDWLVAHGYKARAYYEPETSWECEYKYVEVEHQDGTRLTREEFDNLADEFSDDEANNKLSFWDYVSR